MKRIITYVFLSLVSFSGFAQFGSNLRFREVKINDSIVLDSLSIVPSTLIISKKNGARIPDSLYNVQYDKSTIFFDKKKFSKEEKLHFTYRTFPVLFSNPYPKSSPVFKKDTFDFVRLFKQGEALSASSTFYQEEEDRINITGNIMRGLSVGNRQNVSSNANLNLQINGMLSNDIRVEAYLSDKNIPIQPEGYSQQIEAFDKIYMHFYKDSIFYLKMGDVNISGKETHFLKFNKNIMGGDLGYTHFSSSTKLKNTTQLSAAIAKGNYNRMVFNAIEAVQGPYLLKGKNNESYIVVLAGSEQIYLDGRLLERGENADYVIDYNTAELTFTTKNMLTRNSRIIAEFEYSNQNYNRFLVFAKNSFKYDKLQLDVQFFNEQDAKNHPINMTLTPFHRQVLYEAGDKPSEAFVANVDSVGFNENAVLYRMTDTLVNGNKYDSVLVYSRNPKEAFFRASFIAVGKNKGNYILDKRPINGKAYKWVAPENGILQGEYEPVQMLIAPEKHQVAVVKAKYLLSKNTAFYVESAFSNKDKNTFSGIDKADDKGMALKTQVSHQVKFNVANLFLLANYEKTSKYFQAVSPYKSAEFSRDWNLTQANSYGGEDFLEGKAAFKRKEWQQMAYKIQYLDKNKNYKGLKNNFDANWKGKWLDFKLISSLLHSKDTQTNSLFYRHFIEAGKAIKKINFSINHSFEENKKYINHSDSLLNQSNKFSEWILRLSSPDTLKRYFSIAYKNRFDFSAQQTGFAPLSQTQDFSLSAHLNKSKFNELKALLTWRELSVKNKNLDNQLKDETNFLIRIEDRFKLKKSWLSLFSFYETATGMEAKKTYAYLKVPTGQGLYVWKDYNKNNLPELNEFEVSAFREEADYIRVYTPSNDYIKVYTLKWNETLTINPAKIWQNKTGVKKLIARFYHSFSLQMLQKHTHNNLWSRLQPFEKNIADTMLINSQLRMSNVLSFNRRNPVFGADWMFRVYKQRALFSNGFEQSEWQSNELKMRWNINKQFMLLNKTAYEKKQREALAFFNRNYKILSINNDLTLQWQPDVKLRLSANYTFKKKKNTWGYEQTFIHSIAPKINYSIPRKGVFSVLFAWVNVAMQNHTVSSTVYEMTEGYESGTNYRVEINVAYQLNKYLQLSVNYNARKSQGLRLIHTGQFNLSATF